MTTVTNSEGKLTRRLLKTERLEPHLKFPSGLSVKQAKQNAKALKKEQNISQSEAMKIICWGNGIVDVRDFSQAIPKLIKHTFGLEHDQFGVYGSEEELHGFWYMDGEEVIAIKVSRARQKNSPELLADYLAEHLISLKEEKLKKARFLVALKECINSIGHKFYRTPNHMSLDEVTDKYQIDIDIEELLFGAGGGSGQAVMEYVLGSCYNTSATASLLMRKALELKLVNDDEKHFDISDEHDRERLTDYVSRNRQFGAICSTLDAKNKDIVKRLIDNYHGW